MITQKEKMKIADLCNIIGLKNPTFGFQNPTFENLRIDVADIKLINPILRFQ